MCCTSVSSSFINLVFVLCGLSSTAGIVRVAFVVIWSVRFFFVPHARVPAMAPKKYYNNGRSNNSYVAPAVALPERGPGKKKMLCGVVCVVAVEDICLFMHLNRTQTAAQRHGSSFVSCVSSWFRRSRLFSLAIKIHIWFVLSLLLSFFCALDLFLETWRCFCYETSPHFRTFTLHPFPSIQRNEFARGIAMLLETCNVYSYTMRRY